MARMDQQQLDAHRGATSQDDSVPESAMALDACMLRHVSRVSRAVVAAFDPAFTPHGLTGHQFNLMMTLRQMGPLTVGGLANVLGMDASGVPRAVKPLQEAGLIEVRRGVDRRQRVLELTTAGKRRLQAAEVSWVDVQKELVDEVGADRWTALMADLRDLRRAAAACSTRQPTD